MATKRRNMDSHIACVLCCIVVWGVFSLFNEAKASGNMQKGDMMLRQLPFKMARLLESV